MTTDAPVRPTIAQHIRRAGAAIGPRHVPHAGGKERRAACACRRWGFSVFTG